MARLALCRSGNPLAFRRSVLCHFTRLVPRLVLCAAFSLFLIACSTATAQGEPFNVWLASFRAEAIRVGISPQTARHALQGLKLDQDVLERDQKQPEHTISFATYVKNTLSSARLKKGRHMMQAYAKALRMASRKYGVPPSVIVALWGIESSYGSNMGNFNTINSLATLAYDGRRSSFFRGELLQALRLLDEEKITPSKLRGSWAGAMGQCQFMPSTFRRAAVDADGDGKRNIWSSKPDIFASIAHYLSLEGWKAGYSWGREVHLRKPLPPSLVGLDHRESLASWRARGLVLRSGKPLPRADLSASLVQPDGESGRSFLVYDNFRALMRWNRSTYFATTVGLFSDSLNRSH